MLNGRKNIGLLVFDITYCYQKEIAQEISKLGKEKGYNVLIFTASCCFGARSGNALGENNIMNLIPFDNIDAFIVCIDTLSDKIAENMLYLIDNYAKCPVIFLRQQYGDYYSVVADDSRAISAAVRHFRKTHGFDRIALMSGPKNRDDSLNRINQYINTMDALGLEHPEEYIFEGDYWVQKGKEAARYFAGLENPPQAIVCCNDYMAITVMVELATLGYRVPEDFAVSGFDGIEDSEKCIPSLTTGSVKNKDFAAKAVEVADKLINNIPQPKISKIPSELVIRASCGCVEETRSDVVAKYSALSVQHTELTHLSEQLVFMGITLENLDTAANIGKYLNLDNQSGNLEKLYICLGEGAKKSYPKTYIEYPGFARRHTAVLAMDVDTREEYQSKSFLTSELLPKEILDDKPMSVFFYPLHYKHYNMGYLAMQLKDDCLKNPILVEWITNISNALESLRIRNSNVELVKKLETLYNQDQLTGLSNRRGFFEKTKPLYRKVRMGEDSGVVISMDMDNLKYVNDNFGHSAGDHALTIVADAIENSVVPNSVTARLGGDEFAIYMPASGEAEGKAFVEKCYEFFDKFNAKNEMNFLVTASIGYAVAEPGNKEEIDYYIQISDDRLYENKRERKASVDDQNLSKRR